MKISVVVPAFNAETTLTRCISAIRESRHPDLELIVVDDASTDATFSIAHSLADHVIRHARNLKSAAARNSGLKKASGEIVVIIDSDVVVPPETFTRIENYFLAHAEIDAVTGLLSKKHPHQNFFSQYKNLYMNYIFSRLPERIEFLYGSISAMRKRSMMFYDSEIEITDDTALGQKLTAAGKKIAFLKDLEVIHLKQHTLGSWIKNDFRVPLDWAKIFVRFKGWKKLGKNKSGYMHSPKEQLASVMLTPVIFLLLLLGCFSSAFFLLIPGLGIIWFLLNLRFFSFLTKNRDLAFGAAAVPVTFFDYLVMTTGIVCGLLQSLWNKFRIQTKMGQQEKAPIEAVRF